MSKGDATRQAVIDQAVEIAGRLGVAGLTIGTLASASGMSKSGLYAHFRSKEALQLAVLGSAREHFVDQVIRPALAAPRGEPRVRTLFERWLLTSSSGLVGLPVRLGGHGVRRPAGTGPRPAGQDHWDLIDSLAQVYRSGAKDGAFRDDLAPEQFAHDLHGLMLAHFHACRLLHDPAAEAHTRYTFERLLQSLLR